MFLELLGADARVFGAFQPYAAQGLVLARVATAQRDRYRVFTETGEMEGEPSGTLWHRAPDSAAMPVTGDWVAARIVGPAHTIVEAVLPRRTCFSRRAAGRRECEQPLAANIDLVFVICGLDEGFNPRRLERYLTLAAESRAGAVIVLNKADLCPDLANRVRDAQTVAGQSPVLAMSALGAGIELLDPFLAPGGTVALLGSSGAGKSTIVNRLLGEDRLPTAEVRDSDRRGRHTTTHRELIPLAGRGALIDTPGLREIQLWAGTESIDRTFGEVTELAERCRYRDCSHSGEDGCAVQAALASGALTPGRWESYRKLLAEARRHEALHNPLAAQEQKRHLKRLHKAQRQYNNTRR